MTDPTNGYSAARGAPDFSPGSTRATLEAACRAVGLSAADASLIRLGENALYRLEHQPIVVRIARTMDYWHQVRNEVEVAEWLDGMEYPAARVTGPPGQPIAIDGHPVTFWKFIPGRSALPDEVGVLANLLHRFHALPKPQSFELPRIQINNRVERRLETAPVQEVDKSYLLAKFRELRTALDTLDFPLAESPVHGDAHIKNIMVVDETAILIDFEGVGWGHPEWDLSMTATEYATAKWWTDRQYKTFAEEYGYDITTWDGFDILRQIQEIKMTTWLMQNVSHSSNIAHEFATRMLTIRTGKTSDPWRPY